MDAASHFKLFAELLKTNPQTAYDAMMVRKPAKIGIVPGQDFVRANSIRRSRRDLPKFPKSRMKRP